jgi:hypothetical protein
VNRRSNPPAGPPWRLAYSEELNKAVNPAAGLCASRERGRERERELPFLADLSKLLGLGLLPRVTSQPSPLRKPDGHSRDKSPRDMMNPHVSGIGSRACKRARSERAGLSPSVIGERWIETRFGSFPFIDRSIILVDALTDSAERNFGVGTGCVDDRS